MCLCLCQFPALVYHKCNEQSVDLKYHFRMQKNPPALQIQCRIRYIVIQPNMPSMALKFIWRLALDEYIATVTMTAISIVIAQKKQS